MGLNFQRQSEVFRYECSWSYTGFMEFRERLFRALGYDGLRGIYNGDKWPEGFASHPLYPFFDHSDCEGDIEPRLLSPMADAMEAALNKIDASNDPGAWYDLENGKKLVAAMRECAYIGVPLIFA